jgi:hypothetical protein
MPTLNIDENIKRLQINIEQMTHEVYKLQGMLQIFTDLKKSGVENIDVPGQPENEELDNIQENPE